MCKVVILFLLFIYVQSAPTTKNGAMSYLRNYGYMAKNDENNFKKAMMEFQSYMGLEVTGEMNEESEVVMNLPRCGVADITLEKNGQRRRKRYSIQGSRWRSSVLTYRVTNYSKMIKSETVDKELQEAFDMWSEHINKTFVRKTSGRVDIEIRFASGAHNGSFIFDGPGLVLAYAHFPIFGGDIYFDESEYWTTRQIAGTNFKQVALHEIGHSLGLRHSFDNSAIMFPTYRGYIPDVDLREDDIIGISSLYRWRYPN